MARFPIASFSGFGEIRAAFQPLIMDHGAAKCICGYLFIGLFVAVGHANDIAVGGYIGNIFNGKKAIAPSSTILMQQVDSVSLSGRCCV